MKQDKMKGYVKWSHLVLVIPTLIGLYLFKLSATLPSEVTMEIPIFILLTSATTIVVLMTTPMLYYVIKMEFAK